MVRRYIDEDSQSMNSILQHFVITVRH
jgi:hypothetical protein